MSSESGSMVAEDVPAARRTDTPPRSIFDNYQSAYETIISSGRNFTGNSGSADAANAPNTSSELASSNNINNNNPFADDPTSDHRPRTPSRLGQSVNFETSQENQSSRLPESPESKCRVNFSRPMPVSSSADEVATPVAPYLYDSFSIFHLEDLPQLPEQIALGADQPDLNGPGPIVEEPSTIESVGQTHGNDPGLNHDSVEHEDGIVARNLPGIVGRGRDVMEGSNIRAMSSPAGQPPDVPLPPDPSYAVGRGITAGNLSEASMYEDTGKLLDLTGRAGPSQKISDSLEGRLDSEFSWMGNKGKTSFRDLSTKELKQLQSPKKDAASRASGKSVGVSGHAVDQSSNNQCLLADAVDQPRNMAQRSVMPGKVMENNTRRVEAVAEHFAGRPSVKEGGKHKISAAGNNRNHQEATHAVSEPQADPVLDCGGLQSSSSHGVSLDVSLGDDLFRPGLYMNSSSLASLIGPEEAEVERLSALAKGKKVIRSVEIDEDEDEDDVYAQGEENEGGEWETVGESEMRSKVEIQASISRDTSGSSLANMSSNGTEDGRPATTPWDPLRSNPVFITPPDKAVVNQRTRNPQEPMTVPRYYAHGGPGGPQVRNLIRTTSSTPALSFSATPRYQPKRDMSPTYRHPTPLGRDHQHPFNSSPPPVDIQPPGESFELNDLTDNRKDKRQGLYADRNPFVSNQIGKPGLLKKEDLPTNLLHHHEVSSERSADGSYSTNHPAHHPTEGSSILSPHSPHTPKSAESYATGSINKTKAYLANSPGLTMAESRRYQRLREEMGCGTGGVVRVPGMQQVAPPRAHIPEDSTGPAKPFRAADPPLRPLPRNSFELASAKRLNRTMTVKEAADYVAMLHSNANTVYKSTECPTFPINDQSLQTFFRNKDGTLTNRPKAKRGTVAEHDGRVFEQAWCDVHERWEFSHTPRLTKRIPKDDVVVQRRTGQRLLVLLFVSVIGWWMIVFVVAWDPGHGRNDLIREYSKGTVHTFHEKEIAKARMLAGLMAAVVVVALALVGVYV